MPNNAVFTVGDLELYQVRPPLCGYHVIAAERSMWAMRAQYIDTDGSLVPPEHDDPVSTSFYGVAGEGLDIDRSVKLPGSADGRNVARALAGIGYALY
ncbi:hypothetical protein [Mycobacterium sp. SM3041]|uniref:hypothetical protein n=1 Tax=Mycobacterium sp. SM3041 TaxID=3114291 RepID=UPI0032047861